jgi:hypothetical protein
MRYVQGHMGSDIELVRVSLLQELLIRFLGDHPGSTVEDLVHFTKESTRLVRINLHNNARRFFKPEMPIEEDGRTTTWSLTSFGLAVYQRLVTMM